MFEIILADRCSVVDGLIQYREKNFDGVIVKRNGEKIISLDVVEKGMVVGPWPIPSFLPGIDQVPAVDAAYLKPDYSIDDDPPGFLNGEAFIGLVFHFSDKGHVESIDYQFGKISRYEDFLSFDDHGLSEIGLCTISFEDEGTEIDHVFFPPSEISKGLRRPFYALWRDGVPVKISKLPTSFGHVSFECNESGSCNSLYLFSFDNREFVFHETTDSYQIPMEISSWDQFLANDLLFRGGRKGKIKAATCVYLAGNCKGVGELLDFSECEKIVIMDNEVFSEVLEIARFSQNLRVLEISTMASLFEFFYSNPEMKDVFAELKKKIEIRYGDEVL